MNAKRWAAVAATVLSGVLIAPTALAVPSQDDIDAVREQADQTRAAVADVEVELARSSTAYDEALLRVQISAESYNTAQEELNEAEAAAQAAQDELTDALADLDEARALVAGIAMSAYRNGGNFSQLSMFLSADGISEAISSANTYSILGGHADSAQQQLDAATIAADLAKENADVALEARQDAADALKAAHAQNALEAEVAQEEMNRISAEQGSLLAELAALRNTTVEMERERQDHLDAQRRERENREAQERAQREAEAQAARPSTPSTPDSPSTPSPTQTPDPSPTATSSPDPSPTATAAPSPTASPTPTPTSTPRPTATPTPRPTATPTPTPTPTQKPKPKPTPTPTPPPAPKPSGAGATALAWAKTQIGKPYVWGSAGPNSYDCSGLTSAAFQRAGISLPRNSRAQYGVGSKVALNNLRAGDLIFYSNNGAQSGIYHVGFYAGNGMRLHAPSPGKTVELVPMWYTNIMPYGVRL